MTQITNFRLSFIWIEIVPSVLSKEVPLEEPYGFLGHLGKYAQAFDECQAHKGVRGLSLPWLKAQGQRYWKFYFGGQNAGDMTGAEAWKKQVPFRASLPSRITSIEKEMRVTFEVFYAPCGLALVANAYYRGTALAPLEMAALAQRVRNQFRFINPEAPTSGRSLDANAVFALELARHHAFGQVKGFAGCNQAFSIATIVQGSGVDGDKQLQLGSPEHRALAAMSDWNPKYATMGFDANALKRAAPPKPKALSDLIYTAEKGRAIWLPREFATSSPRRTSRLCCFHRNLTLASVQTLLLGEFVDWVAVMKRDSTSVAPLLIERAKPAARLLEFFAAGDAHTYRSNSVSALIADAKWQSSIDYIKSL
jgi:hypothetical protein